MTVRFYPLGPCPACGDHIDYCQGHGELGDTWGYNVLILHDDGNHSRCHPMSDCRNDVQCSTCGYPEWWVDNGCTACAVDDDTATDDKPPLRPMRNGITLDLTQEIG